MKFWRFAWHKFQMSSNRALFIFYWIGLVGFGIGGYFHPTTIVYHNIPLMLLMVFSLPIELIIAFYILYRRDNK